MKRAQQLIERRYSSTGISKLKFHAFLLPGSSSSSSFSSSHPKKSVPCSRGIDSQRHRRTVEIASFFSSAEQLILGKFSFVPPVRRCRNQFQFLRADCRHLNTFPNTSESSRLIAASIEIEIEIVTNNCLLLAQNYIPSRQRVA